MMEETKLLRYQVCAAIGLCMSILGVISLEYVIPSMEKRRILKAIALKDDWPARKTWNDLSFSNEFRAYLFNITNPDEISNGGKPIVREIGPYVYDVRLEKVEVADHEENDTVSFKVKKTFYFNATKSYPLSDEDELILTHYLILGTATGVIKTRPTVLPLVSKSIDRLFDNPKSMFFNTKVKTYMFDGYELNCVGVEDFFAKAMCSDIEEFWYDYLMVKIRDGVYTSSTMGTWNNTLAWIGETRIDRGIRNITKIGEFVEYNHTKNFGKWGDEKCDKFVGTDGTMFRPFLSRNDDLHVVFERIKRRLTFRYDSDVVHDGINCYRYVTMMGIDLETNPDDKCYCAEPDRCFKHDVFDTWKALQFVAVVSNPHFYLADPYYDDIIVGFHPDQEKHISYIDVHPLTGSVVSSKIRTQWCVPVSKQPKYRLMKNMADTLLPLGWFEDSFTMPESNIKRLKKLSFMIAMEKVCVYIVLAIGLALFSVGVACEVLNRRK